MSHGWVPYARESSSEDECRIPTKMAEFTGAWSKSAAYPHTGLGELREGERQKDYLLSINPRERPGETMGDMDDVVGPAAFVSCGNQIRLKGKHLCRVTFRTEPSSIGHLLVGRCF